jgi:hypothetical protein
MPTRRKEKGVELGDKHAQKGRRRLDQGRRGWKKVEGEWAEALPNDDGMKPGE